MYRPIDIYWQIILQITVLSSARTYNLVSADTLHVLAEQGGKTAIYWFPRVILEMIAENAKRLVTT